jgi:hypothetical protein
MSISDVQRWQAQEPITSCSSADLQRIREAVVVLSHPTTRDKVQPLLKEWHVPQFSAHGGKSVLSEVLPELQSHVITAAKEFQVQSSDSAEQPASSTDGVDFAQCSDWLNDLPSKDVAQSKPLLRLQSAIFVLQSSASRQKRRQLQELAGDWDVPQTTRGRKRSQDEMSKHLVSKVVEETRRLKRMQDNTASANALPSAEQPVRAGACFSAIQASLSS